MKNKMNKRGQIFTIIAILIMSLMFASFEIYSSIHDRNTIKNRVSTMNSFLDSIETNMERQMYISGFRILFLAENEITSTGSYINVNNFFNEAFFNGTINGESNNTILLGATYNDLLNSINQKAEKINTEISLSNTSIEITQEDPWNVKFSMTSNFIMSDKEDLAKWERQQVVSALIPVSEFEDPLYIVNTYARISQKIVQTPYEGSYVSGTDVSNLITHAANSYYSANSNAPNFLNRLEGDLSADENGIESFVNTQELSNQGLPVSTKSNIDYIYFSANNPVYYSVSGMPSWFRIDAGANHTTKYQVGGLI